MDTKLIDFIVIIINSLTSEERQILEEKLFFNHSEITTKEIMHLAQTSHSFDFLHKEPELYTLDDGEPV